MEERPCMPLPNGIGCLDLLLEAGADKDAQDSAGRTALMLATWAGQVECVDSLLNAGADMDAQGYDGDTALMRACLIMDPDVR